MKEVENWRLVIIPWEGWCCQQQPCATETGSTCAASVT